MSIIFRVASLTAILCLALTLTGCPSFESSIKPLIAPGAPPGYTPPTYIKGTKDIDDVDPSQMSLDVWRVDSEPYPDSVRLFVRVFDREGHLVQNLAPPYYSGGDDYRKVWSGLSEQIGDGGKVFPITDFTVREFSDKDGIPYEIALVLDYSGTMASSITSLEQAAGQFIEMKRDRDRIALVKFDKEPRLVSPLTDSKSDLLAKLGNKGLEGYGTYTALYSAGKLGGEQLAAAPPSHPRALVIFTDGEDNASISTASDLAVYAKENDIPVFTIAFGAVNREVLIEIASYTSGRFYQTYSTAELTGAFQDIFYSLRNYYLVSYRPPYVPGKHIVRLAMSPPRGTGEIAATATYRTEHAGDTAVETFEVAEHIYFDYNRATIRPESMQIIESWATLMKDRPRVKIEVRGHTDSKGTEEYNQKLSEARAEAVRTALIERGVEESRVRSRGFGMSQPVATNETDEGRQMNRRTTFVILAR